MNSWDTIIDSIDTASNSIHVGAFLWRDDNLGNRIAESLLRAADRWVTITIEKDAWGLYHEWAEWTHQSLLHTSGSVKEYVYTMLKRPKFVSQNRKHEVRDFLYNHANISIVSLKKEFIDHSKFLLIDDVFVQWWMNIGDEYDQWWVDFMMHMNFSGTADDVKEVLERPGISECSGYIWDSYKLIRDIPWFDTHEMSNHKLQVQESIGAAQEYIIMCGWYLSDDDIISWLIEKSQRSPEVSIQILCSANPNIQKYDMQLAMQRLQTNAPNIDIVYSREMIHAKVYLTDKVLWLWSSNFDHVSWKMTWEFWIESSWNDDMWQTFQDYFQIVRDKNRGIQTELSELFMERNIKSRIESYLQRFILRTNLLQPKN